MIPPLLVSCGPITKPALFFPLHEIAETLEDRGIVFHTDAVQAVGKIPIDLSTLSVDMLSLSGHKLHAPKGMGALYVRKGTKFSPFLIGGHQEHGAEAARKTPHPSSAWEKHANWPVSISMMKICVSNGLGTSWKMNFWPVLKMHPSTETPINRLPNTTSIGFDSVEGEAILLLLDQFGICASSGSACTSGSLEPSHVLRAMGVPFTSAHGSIRFSLSRYNTEEHIDYIIEHLPPIIKRLRQMSPFWKKRQTG